MTGLLLKDFMLLKNQKNFFAVCVLIGGAFLVFYDNPNFVISYVSIMMSMFTVSSITYDEHENGMAYLFTLPVSRKQYVTGKYVFGALLSVMTLAVVSALSWLAVSIKGIEYTVEEWAGALAASVLVITIFLGAEIPLQLKFKAEQSRIALFALVAAFVAVIFTAVKLCDISGINVTNLIDKLINESLGLILACWAAAVILILAASYTASVKIMKNKEL